MIRYLLLLISINVLFSANLFADTIIPMHFTTENDNGVSAGTITISQTPYGLLFTPHLHGLTPGAHGLHIHQNPSCDKNGLSAGGHFDPQNTEQHLGPYNNDGHHGDLPILFVNAEGIATLPILAPRLQQLSAITQRALIIHAAGDNYSDIPDKLGGGGARVACGIIN